MTSVDTPAIVSVVIITYNHRPFIEEALASVLSQDFSEEWEVIVADDCSTDGTTEYLVKLAACEPRLTLLTTPVNRGAQRNLRRAIEAATGEFIALLEGDDYWTDPTKLSQQVAHLRHNQVQAVGHWTSTRILTATT